MLRVQKLFSLLMAVFVSSGMFFLSSCSDQEFVVSVDSPLRILSISPADGSGSVVLETEIKAVFSEDVVETTLTNDSFIVSNTTDPENIVKVEGEIKYDKTTHTVTFTPAEPLKYSSNYEIVFKTTIQKADTSNSIGGNLAIETKALFNTLDPDNLTVIYTNPGAGAWDVPIRKDIKIVFSHPVDQTTVAVGTSIIVEDITDAENPVVVEPAEENGLVFSEDGKELTFSPADIYGYSREIRVTLTSAVKTSIATTSSGFLKENFVAVFGTVNPPALSIESVMSGSGTSPMKRNFGEGTDTLIIKFSEGVKQASATLGTNIVIEDVTGLADPENDTANGIIAGDISWNGTDAPDPETVIGSDNVVTFTPDELLLYGTKIRVTLIGQPLPSMDGILSDRATNKGGQLSATKIYLFDVEIIPDFVVTRMTPGNGSDQIPINMDVTVTFSEGIDCDTLENEEEPSVKFVFDSTDPENPDGDVVYAIAPDCADGDTTVTFVPTTDIKYSRDVKVVLENSVASLRAKDINDAFDPLQGHLREGYTALYSTIDPPALGVINVGTASGKFLMSVDDAIVVGFSEGVAQTTAILGTSFIVEDVTGLADPLNGSANGIIPGSLFFSSVDAPDPVTLIGSDNIVTFIPTVNFPYGTKIRVTIPGSADAVSGIMTSDRATVRGGHNTKDVVFLLEVYRLEELKVLMTVPAHDNRSVASTEKMIKVIFSAAPDCTTINDTNIVVKYDDGLFVTDPLDGSAGTLIPGSWQCVTDNKTITFTADSEFGFSRDFAVMLSSNIRDARASTVSPYDPTQGYLVPAFNFGFGTADNPPLSVKIVPPHNTVAVSPSVHPECIFSKPIKPATVENEPAPNPEFPDADGIVPNICLVKGFNKNSCDDPDIIALDPVTPYSYTDSNTTVVINPAATLDTEEWYTVVVSRDIEDTTGMRLTALNTASFKTSPGGLLNRVYIEGDTLDTMKVVAEFNEDVDVSTVNKGTFYLSFINEFGGTTLVPGTVELDNWAGGGTCDPLSGNEHCDMAIFTPDFLALFSCGETHADPQFELPMNTNFKAHLSTFIKNADYSTDPSNVPATGGDNQYIYSFITPVPSAVHSVTYLNMAVTETSLDGGDEVPVNAAFRIKFHKPVDPASFNSDTIEIEDGRGDDGVTTSGSTTFTVTTSGTFKTSDAGKKIQILYGANAGIYTINSVTSSTAVVLDTALSVDAAGVSWSKIIDGSLFNFFSSSDKTEVVLQPDKNLEFHTEYSGYSVNVTGSTVTIATTLNNFRVNAQRDLGRSITIYGSATADNNLTATITAVNEGTNSYTINRTFASAQNGLRWRVFSDNDYHILKIKGRTRSNSTNYIKDAESNPVPGILTQKFITSPETFVKFHPEDITNPGVGQRAMAIFSRPVITHSVTEDTLYYIVSGVQYYTLPTFYSHDARLVLLTTIPSYSKDGVTLQLTATNDIFDYRGNPFKERTVSLGTSSNAPSASAMTPAAGVLTPSNGSSIRGNHRFRITWSNDSRGQTMNAGLINDDTSDLVQIIATGTGGTINTGSINFSATGTPFAAVENGYYIEVSGASNSADNGRWKIVNVIASNTLETDHVFNADNTNISWTVVKKYPIRSDYYPNVNTSGDIAEFQPVEGIRNSQYMPAGANIRLRVYFSKIANLYNLSALPGDDITYNYTVESTPPVLNSIKAVSESLGLTVASGATDIKADSSIIFIFNEDIDSTTVNSDNLKLFDKDGLQLNCNYRIEGNVVTVIPYDTLRSDLSPYEVTAGALIKDVAGNALGSATTISFSVETTPPDFVATNPADVTPAWSVSKPLEMYFTEPMNAASAKAGAYVTYDIPAGCNSGDITGIVEGCIAIDRTKTFVTFTPYSGQFMDETDYLLVVEPTLSDLAGNILGGGDHEFNFDTFGGDNGPANALCSDIPSSEVQTYVDVYFSEPVDTMSVILGTVIVYDVNSGEEVAGTISFEAGDTVIRFTADTAFMKGSTYGIIISDEILGADGLPIAEYYRAFFSIPL